MLIMASVGGAKVGYDYRDGKVAKEVAAAQKTAIDEHNAHVQADVNAAYEQGKKEAKIRVVTRTIQGEANAVTASTPIPLSCRLDIERRRLLDKAIAVANGDEPTTSGVPDSLPKGKPPIVK